MNHFYIPKYDFFNKMTKKSYIIYLSHKFGFFSYLIVYEGINRENTKL
jgi:hypothetical protein